MAKVRGPSDSESGSIYERIKKGKLWKVIRWLSGWRNHLTDGIDDVIFEVSSPRKSCAVVQHSCSAKGESSINFTNAVFFKEISSYLEECMSKESINYEKSNWVVVASEQTGAADVCRRWRGVKRGWPFTFAGKGQELINESWTWNQMEMFWGLMTQKQEVFMEELIKEIMKGHSRFGCQVSAIAWRMELTTWYLKSVVLGNLAQLFSLVGQPKESRALIPGALFCSKTFPVTKKNACTKNPLFMKNLIELLLPANKRVQPTRACGARGWPFTLGCF